MSTTNVQYSGGQYAQGLVLAQLQMMAPEMAQLINEETKTLVQMSKSALNSALSAASSALMGSLAQAGTSAAGAVAGGVSASSGASALTSIEKENATFTAKRAENDLKLLPKDAPTLQIKDPSSSHEVDEKGNVIDASQKKTEEFDPEALKRQRKDLINDNKQKMKTINQEHEVYSSRARAVQSAAEVLTQPVNGWQQKQQQEHQGLQNIENQSSQQADASKDQAVSTWTSLIQGVGEVQGYTSAMAR